MSDSQRTFTYEIALSFAGEDRANVEELAGELRRRDISVFYDRYEQPKLWGRNLYDYLTDLYSKQCRYCVVFISHAYATKEWTRLERSSAQARALKENAELFLPVRLDDAELPGLLSTIAYVDLREQSISGLADLICAKLGCESAPRRVPGQEGRLVIELRSEFKYDFNKSDMIGIHDKLIRVTDTPEARIVGFETSPHRVQIQTVLQGYSNLGGWPSLSVVFCVRQKNVGCPILCD